jgi:hypothetical protein
MCVQRAGEGFMGAGQEVDHAHVHYAVRNIIPISQA